MTFPLSNVTWRPSYRVIPSRFPPIDLFEGVNSNADDWDLLNELEGETSARLREEAGAIHLVRDDDRRYGPGWTPVMAAFCHFPATGSRFSDGTFGAYYCTLTEATAIAETVYHAERFMGESNEPPMMLQQRVYLSDLTGQLIDLRRQDAAQTLLRPDSWAAGQLGKPWGEKPGRNTRTASFTLAFETLKASVPLCYGRPCSPPQCKDGILAMTGMVSISAMSMS